MEERKGKQSTSTALRRSSLQGKTRPLPYQRSAPVRLLTEVVGENKKVVEADRPIPIEVEKRIEITFPLFAAEMVCEEEEIVEIYIEVIIEESVDLLPLIIEPYSAASHRAHPIFVAAPSRTRLRPSHVWVVELFLLREFGIAGGGAQQLCFGLNGIQVNRQTK